MALKYNVQLSDSASVSYGMTKFGLTTLLSVVGLLMLHWAVRAIHDPSDLCGAEAWQGRRHHTRQMHIFNWLIFSGLSLAGTGMFYIWQDARPCPNWEAGSGCPWAR